MKRTWMGCLVGLLLFASAAWSQDKTEKAVAALEQQWLQSQKTNNPDLAAPLLADKFINTGADGKSQARPRPWLTQRRPNMTASITKM